MSDVRISIIMAAYNRANTLPRAIDSVLRQLMPDWELLIVDDASTDNTREVLARYHDRRIRVFRHEHNRGASAAKNTGFDHMMGEWFTTLDSDDELIPEALGEALRPTRDISPAIDAVTANCLDTTTGEFSGKGLGCDGWLDFETLVTKCEGEHWGITKRAVLGDLRFNERMRGGEGVVWFKISRHAKRYYVHKALRIYHTEGADRICRPFTSADLARRCAFYSELAEETEYLEILRRYRPREYANTMFGIVAAHVMEHRHPQAAQAYQEAAAFWRPGRRWTARLLLMLGAKAARGVARLAARRS